MFSNGLLKHIFIKKKVKMESILSECKLAIAVVDLNYIQVGR